MHVRSSQNIKKNLILLFEIIHKSFIIRNAVGFPKALLIVVLEYEFAIFAFEFHRCYPLVEHEHRVFKEVGTKDVNEELHHAAVVISEARIEAVKANHEKIDLF